MSLVGTPRHALLGLPCLWCTRIGALCLQALPWVGFQEQDVPFTTQTEVWQRFAGKWARLWEQRFFMGTPNRRPTAK
jgi:hypothetical protein